jgi:hypothetical protein
MYHPAPPVAEEVRLLLRDFNQNLESSQKELLTEQSERGF